MNHYNSIIISQAIAAASVKRQIEDTAPLEFIAQGGANIRELYLFGKAETNAEGRLVSLGEELSQGQYKINIIKQNQRICDGYALAELISKNMPELQITVDKNSLILNSSKDVVGYIITNKDIQFKKNKAYIFVLKTECDDVQTDEYDTHLRIVYTNSDFDDFYCEKLPAEEALPMFESDYNKSIFGLCLRLSANKPLYIDISSFGIYADISAIGFKECETCYETKEIYLDSPLYSLNAFGSEVSDKCELITGKVERKIACQKSFEMPKLLKKDSEYPIYFIELDCERDMEIPEHYLEGFTPLSQIEELENTPYASLMSEDGYHLFFTLDKRTDADAAYEHLKSASPCLIYARQTPIYETFMGIGRIRLTQYNRIFLDSSISDAKIKIIY